MLAVYEIKSRLTVKNIDEAYKHLGQLNEFSEQLDKNYSCGVIFIELKESENNNSSILNKLYQGRELYGFAGGVVLRYEGDDSITGFIMPANTEGKENDSDVRSIFVPLAKPIDDLNIYRSEDGKIQ